jgi:hypothetical protein
MLGGSDSIRHVQPYLHSSLSIELIRRAGLSGTDAYAPSVTLYVCLTHLLYLVALTILSRYFPSLLFTALLLFPVGLLWTAINKME